MSVGAIDLAILLAYMAGVVFVGMWVGRVTRTAADFMVGGRDLPWWVILFSIVATETSTVTFLSIPGFAYGRDMTWLQIVFGFVVGRFIVAFLLLPQYFKGNFFTAYEVLDKRFGGATKRTASVIFIVTRSLADGLRLFLSAIVLQEMTGIPMHWAVVTIGVATIVYTYLGGMRAVLWTDFLQFMVYMGGALLAFWLLLDHLPGGWQQMMSMGEAAGKLRFLDFTLDWSEPYGFWAGLIGGMFITLGSHGVDQMMVQRYLAARNLSDARRALITSGFVVLAQFALFLLIGAGLYCFYQLFPPEVAFERADRVFARFILDEIPVGVLGVLLGAIFAAAMSTLSSSLNSCATAAANDLYFPLVGSEITPARKLRVIRILTACFGLVQIAVGIAGQWLQSTVVASVLGIAAFTTGIVLGVFFLGIFTERVGQRAALAGLVVGLAGMLVIFFATPLAWPWFALVGSLGTFAVGLAASYIWPREMPPASQ
ncbi:MAG: sodium:solute symporter [Thermoanaerobaculia bacterium]|jgi:SSS family transporter